MDGRSAPLPTSANETEEGSQCALEQANRDAPWHEGFPVSGWERYRFVAALGHGGMGSVYRAVDPRLEREVALKFIRGGDPRLTMRLLREARAQARVEHVNVCKVFEVGEVAGKAYIAMELVDGRPLNEAAKDMSLHDKVLAIRDVALALHEAHKLGILHRDVKPSNILVETGEDGRHRPIVMDFGIARDDDTQDGLTETGAVLGTPAYMSPEQARGGGRVLDRRSDVYSVGATLYELLAGVPPFQGASPLEIVLSVLSEDVLPLRARVRSVPEDLETIVSKCLVKEPGQRYDSAKALAEDLDRYVRGEPILGRREPWLRRWRRLAGRHKAEVVTASLALLGLIVAGVAVVDAQLTAARREAELTKQTELAHELTRDVEEIEWFLRTAFMLPLHDTTPERAFVRLRMEQLGARFMGTPAADALVDYAIGRGHQVLHEDEQAYDRLVRALEGGLDTPDLHYALGLTLGRIYDKKREELERLGDPRTIEAERERLDAEYLVSAREHLQAASGSELASPAYLEGLLAFYSHRYPEAIVLAETAQQQAPWLYEAKVLGGNARIASATIKLERGEYDAAEQEIRDALRLFEAASEIARSDDSVYEAEASAWTELLNHNHDRGGDLDEPYRKAVEACRRAATAAPASAVAYEKEVHAHARLVSAWIDYYRDPTSIVEAALPAAERALALGGGGPGFLDQLANLHSMQGHHEMNHGIDPRAALDRADPLYRRAVEADPSFVWGWNDWGTTRLARGKWAMQGGGSVTEILHHLQKSLDMYERAVELDPGYVVAHSNIVFNLSLQAQVIAETGGPVPAVVGEASRAAARGLSANDSYFNTLLNLAGAHHVDARHRLLAGLDPGPAVDATIEQASAAIRLNQRAPTHCYIADARRIAAERLLTHGGDPTVELERGWAVLENPHKACAPAEDEAARARLLALRARWLERLGQPADETWEQAWAVLASARRRHVDHTDLLLATAEIALQRAETARAGGRRADGDLVAEGLAATARVVERQPWIASARALQAALLLVEAGDHEDSTARRRTAERAREALRVALAANAHLRRRYEPLLARAEQLAES